MKESTRIVAAGVSVLGKLEARDSRLGSQSFYGLALGPWRSCSICTLSGDRKTETPGLHRRCKCEADEDRRGIRESMYIHMLYPDLNRDEGNQ